MILLNPEWDQKGNIIFIPNIKRVIIALRTYLTSWANQGKFEFFLQRQIKLLFPFGKIQLKKKNVTFFVIFKKKSYLNFS